MISRWMAFWMWTCLMVGTAVAQPVSGSLFDGKTFAGWEGDTNQTWRIVGGTLEAGSLQVRVPRNDFLVTRRAYTNFVLRLQVRLLGTEGFVNSGVQIRSERVPNHHEMVGYQADVGAGWWGALYDESRRNTVLAKPDPEAVEKVVRVNDWNDYEIRAEGRRVVLKLNGLTTVDYTEPDLTLAQHGRIGLQIHGDGKAVVAFRALTMEELP